MIKCVICGRGLEGCSYMRNTFGAAYHINKDECRSVEAEAQPAEEGKRDWVLSYPAG